MQNAKSKFQTCSALHCRVFQVGLARQAWQADKQAEGQGAPRAPNSRELEPDEGQASMNMRGSGTAGGFLVIDSTRVQTNNSHSSTVLYSFHLPKHEV